MVELPKAAPSFSTCCTTLRQKTWENVTLQKPGPATSTFSTPSV